MSYNKKDYAYDIRTGEEDEKDEVSSSDDETDKDEKEAKELSNKLMANIDTKFPREWVNNLYYRLKEMAEAKGVSLLDKSTPDKLAEFADKFEIAFIR